MLANTHVFQFLYAERIIHFHIAILITNQCDKMSNLGKISRPKALHMIGCPCESSKATCSSDKRPGSTVKIPVCSGFIMNPVRVILHVHITMFRSKQLPLPGVAHPDSVRLLPSPYRSVRIHLPLLYWFRIDIPHRSSHCKVPVSLPAKDLFYRICMQLIFFFFHNRPQNLLFPHFYQQFRSHFGHIVFRCLLSYVQFLFGSFLL